MGKLCVLIDLTPPFGTVVMETASHRVVTDIAMDDNTYFTLHVNIHKRHTVELDCAILLSHIHIVLV